MTVKGEINSDLDPLRQRERKAGNCYLPSAATEIGTLEKMSEEKGMVE
jgi:hypothetical protein